MGLFDAEAKAAARAYFSRERALSERLSADPADWRAALEFCRLQVKLDRPMKVLHCLAAPELESCVDPDFHRQACEIAIEIGAFWRAETFARLGLAHGGGADLELLLSEAAERHLEQAALGLTPALKRRYLKALQQLVHGQFHQAVASFEGVIAGAPEFYGAWIGMRGALEGLGDDAAVQSMADRWAAISPRQAAVARVVMGRRLSASGLLVDRRTAAPFCSLRDAAIPVTSLAELEVADCAYLPLEVGGAEVTLDTVISRQDDGSDRIVLKHRTPEIFLAGVENAAIVGRGGVINADGRIIRELHAANLRKYGMAQDAGRVGFDPIESRGWLGEVAVHDRPALLMTGAADRSFGDWLLHYMPRVSIAQSAGLNCAVVVSTRTPEPFLELLRQVGVRDEDILFHDSNGVSLFPRLYVTSSPMPDFLTPMDGLFDILEGLSLPPGSGSGRRIYLSRERVSRRIMENEGEVAAALSLHGFEIVHPQDLSLPQMRELMSQADYVAAAYGSALLNLPFASRKPKVIVFAPPTKMGFMRQAALWLGLMGLSFSYVVGDQVGGLGKRGIKDFSWVAPLGEVEQAIAATLKHG